MYTSDVYNSCKACGNEWIKFHRNGQSSANNNYFEICYSNNTQSRYKKDLINLHSVSDIYK